MFLSLDMPCKEEMLGVEVILCDTAESQEGQGMSSIMETLRWQLGYCLAPLL